MTWRTTAAIRLRGWQSVANRWLAAGPLGGRASFAAALVIPLLLLGPWHSSAQVLTLGTASGPPGQQVWFNATFDTEDISVSAILVRILFDRNNTPVGHCEQADAGVGKQVSFRRLPDPCGGGGEPQCTSVRVMVHDQLVESSRALIGSKVVFRCRVDIAPGAVPNTYPLVVESISGSDPPGHRKSITGVNGSITVQSTGPGPGPGC